MLLLFDEIWEWHSRTLELNGIIFRSNPLAPEMLRINVPIWNIYLEFKIKLIAHFQSLHNWILFIWKLANNLLFLTLSTTLPLPWTTAWFMPLLMPKINIVYYLYQVNTASFQISIENPAVYSAKHAYFWPQGRVVEIVRPRKKAGP